MILGSKPMIRHRFGPDVDEEDGTTTNTDMPDLDFMGSFQPATGEDVKVLPEGDRKGSFYVILTYTDLRAADQYTGIQSDEITFEGVRYKVKNVLPTNAVIEHYEALVAKLDEGSS